MATTTTATASASPFLFQSSLHDPGLIHEMMSNPLQFGPPVAKKGMGFENGMKEVINEPESPKPVKKQLFKQDDEEMDAQRPVMAMKEPDDSSVKSQGKLVNGERTETIKKLQAKQTSDLVVTDKKALSLHPSTFDLTWPEPIATAKRAAGLYNPSMACYANATLQVLLHTPPVLRIALAHDEGSCMQRQKKNFCMLCSVKHMAESNHWNGKNAYSPEVHKSLNQLKKGFSKNRQEDTHEFFRFVTDAFQNTATARLPKDTSEKIKHTSWVYRLWGGRVRSRVVCSQCNNPSDTFDNFLDLSLDLNKNGKKTIQGMLLGFTKEDKLEGDNKYHCDKCKRKANATKSFKLEQSPPILTLHLKRFSVNYNAYSGRARAEKYNQFIEFGEKLDIAPYMVDPTTPGCKYKLFGVTCHRGAELRFGHYTSYVKGPSGQWFHADDDDMSPVTLEQVLSDKTAYLLSYIRVEDGEDMSEATPQKLSRVNGLVNAREQEESDEEDNQTPSPVVVKRKRAYDPENQPRMKISLVPKSSPQKPASVAPPLPPTSTLSTNDMPPELPPSKFGYSPKPKPNTSDITQPSPVEASSFYNSSISRGSSSSMNKKEKKKFKHQKDNRKARHSATPMPFTQGRKNLGRNREPGVLGRMKGRA